MIPQLELTLRRWWKGITPPPLQSIFHHYQLPPLQRIAIGSNKVAKRLLTKARVLQRAEAVTIPFHQIEDFLTYQTNLQTKIQTYLPQFKDVATTVVFNGNKTSILNQLLKDLSGRKSCIYLQGQTLEVDEPLVLPSQVRLNGQGAILATTQPMIPASIVIMQDQVAVLNLTIQTPGLGLLIKDARHVIVDSLHITNSERGIAVLGKSQFLELARLWITYPKGGLMIQGEVSHLWLHDSHILHGNRADNGGAGIVITDSSPKPSVEEHSWGHSLTENIWPLEQPAPHALLIENNVLSGHVAQGIYLDGGYGIVIRNNQITDNDKEGICLDFGSANNIIMENIFLNNGRRFRQTDEDLRADLVMNFGRLADGSATSKLPAVSLDNAAQNIVIWNVIRDSAGDGIKVVRTGIRNLLLFNTIMDNNRGESQQLHFAGILLGNAKLEAGIDPTNHPLDFLPPLENIVAGNVIYGKHYHGILLDHDAIFNDIYDNMVRHYRRHPIAQANRRYNSVVGNSWQAAAPKGRKLLLLLGIILGYVLTHPDLSHVIEQLMSSISTWVDKLCQICLKS
jgi:parallel beta-helix repeat protein